MRNWINIINEGVVVAEAGEVSHKKGSAVMTGSRTASPERTAAAFAKSLQNGDLTIPQDMVAAAASIGGTDIIPDDRHGTALGDLNNHYNDAIAGLTPDNIPRTPETLPMVIHNDIVASGDEFDPEWHQVKNLPGYMLSGIRLIARQLFSRFTTTPIEDIQMIGTTLNPTPEVQKVMAWIKKHGQKEDEMVMDFSQYIPNYTAQVQVWRMSGFQFALCHDISGYYVYGWPETNREVTDLHTDDEPLQIA